MSDTFETYNSEVEFTTTMAKFSGSISANESEAELAINCD